MAKWNTEQIILDLGCIIPVTAIENKGGEDATTDVLVLTLGGVNDELFVKGFVPGQHRTRCTNNIDVSHIELADNPVLPAGLTSTDFRLARAYIDVRQYFINRGFTVVPSMEEYFDAP